ncbi:Uncharacterized protein ALO80_03801 [Pseudomonas caricapapayae]|uniref:Uncharacterized protein n=1 Tax=Pseudomonas caricapapayae TaxID=46678 RepID=A0A0P9KPA2_9PSED|nr:hypothetical protein [Pseudomonas caricapapayae]KPW63283.1 Uncharacterized protein ALO80_03801 [Pseudomonas caricapapayae]RMM15048.1 hypothetical protein ALQ84_00539 [Pseudomonas caricapapayae]RMV97316.1 hypothetical protein ALP01_01468 [Pseudomonas caricapapayae]
MAYEISPEARKIIEVDGWSMFDYNSALPFYVEGVAAYFPVLLNFLSQHRGV